MKITLKNLPIAVAALILSSNALAVEHEVGQKDKQFTVEAITVAVGDTVKFINEDPFFHNIFSLSDAKFFDLGSFPQGEFKSVTFDAAGVVDVECAIHPGMVMQVTVE